MSKLIIRIFMDKQENHENAHMYQQSITTCCCHSPSSSTFNAS